MLSGHASKGDEFGRIVTFRKPKPGEFPYYELPGDQLSHGASLGNRKIWVNTESSGHIKRVFCNAVGRNLLGSVLVMYAVPTQTLLTAFPEPEKPQTCGPAYVLLEREGPGVARVFPFRQERVFDLAGELHIEETVLVPKVVHEDPPAVLQHIRITNESERDASVLVTLRVNMQGDLGDDLVVEFDKDLGALEIYNESNPDWVRVVGTSGCQVAYRTTRDVSAAYPGEIEKRFSEEPSASPGPIGELQVELSVGARETAETTAAAVLSSSGLDDARSWYGRLSAFQDYQDATSRFLVPASAMSMVETPDPIINQGVFWAKVDMLKVIADYPQGPAFTNDPGNSSNVVARDSAWFVYGCDFLEPGFSKSLLTKFAGLQYENGKIPEYYSALDGHVEDYGLSMNDNTPLFILACCHHYALSHDETFLDIVGPSMKRAADFTLQQIDDRGLVVVKADGYNVHGIASWRNVIPDYQINGAVTEVNSECYAAFRALARLCEDTGEAEASRKYDKAADDLRDAINKHLLNPENGLYYLNIDSSGLAHTDVTSDEVFPVLFGAATDKVAGRIISRMREEDFMSGAGPRTVPNTSPEYEPTQLVGLKGGVWPGVAFWYAFAAAKAYPEFMVESLHASYLQYLADPLKNNTVPGQFSEWFDGDSLVNRGMRLSPWEPPRLLWAALEGLCGVTAGNGRCRVAPTHPEHWKWLALRRMPYRDGFLTFFLTVDGDGVNVYSSAEVDTPYGLCVAGDDVSHKAIVSDYRIHRAAFAHDGELTLCLGSEANTFTTVSVLLDGLLDQDADYNVGMCSRASGWVDIGTRTGASLSDVAVNIEGGEFRVVTMKRK